MIGCSQWMPFLELLDSMLDDLNSTTFLGVPLVRDCLSHSLGFVMMLTHFVRTPE
jgi:hypothetical protein